MAITFNGYTPSFAFIMYVLISSMAGIMILQYLYKANKPMATMLCLVLLILVFIFFEMRWFTNLRLKGSSSYVAPTPSTSGCAADSLSVDASVNSNWPPIINICPDYMVSEGGSCIDINRLYGNKGGGNGNPAISIARGNKKCSDYNIPYLRWEGIVESDGQCIQSKIP